MKIKEYIDNKINEEIKKRLDEKERKNPQEDIKSMKIKEYIDNKINEVLNEKLLKDNDEVLNEILSNIKILFEFDDVFNTNYNSPLKSKLEKEVGRELDLRNLTVDELRKIYNKTQNSKIRKYLDDLIGAMNYLHRLNIVDTLGNFNPEKYYDQSIKHLSFDIQKEIDNHS